MANVDANGIGITASLVGKETSEILNKLTMAGYPIEIDPNMPEDTILFKDASGKIVGCINNLAVKNG
jgi:hypothetical protein